MEWKRSLGVVSALLVGFAGTAYGEMHGDAEKEKGGITAESFQRYDTNGDGMVSLEEAKAAENETLANNFDTYDENNSQSLDEGEFAQFAAEEGQIEEEAGTGHKEERLNE